MAWSRELEVSRSTCRKVLAHRGPSHGKSAYLRELVSEECKERIHEGRKQVPTWV